MASLHLLHFLLLLFLFLFPISSTAVIRRTIRIVSLDDLKDTPSQSPSSSSSTTATTPSSSSDDSTDWDDFNDPDPKPVPFVDSGSWRQAVEYSSSTSTNTSSDPTEMSYLSGLRGLILGDGDEAVEESVMELEKAAAEGFAHAQSVMGFVYGAGVGRKRSKAKAMVYHRFAADGGNSQSKLALAYNYFRHGMYENSVVLYSELAEAAVASFMMSKDQPVIEIIRIHNGVEENKDALKKFRGEADEAFQVTEHQALRGDAGAMYKMGMFYYFGLRGVGRDNKKAFNWFLKAVEKGEPKSMELLGEIYASGAGVERNYTKALEWLTRASQQKHSSAFNGLGYLYVKGYGVEKNYTKAKIYFEKAANNFEAGGYYNLGVLYLKGIGVQRDVAAAKKFFVTAGNAGQPKALYQLGKMFQKGIGLKKNLAMATLFYKMVAERGPWSSLSTWALDFYLKGYVGKALLIYLRMAELGCEVAQSNAAWILDKYGDSSMCIGEFGFCTSTERHLLQHSLWWQASEQGNEHAALLIGDAYYYGRGMERDYDYAAEAYMQAQSQANSQAMFNLGYMHERGEGLPLDLHLAKRYYDQALERDSDAKLAVTLALTSLWVRKNYADTILVDLIDSLPRLYPRLEAWVEEVIVDEGNATILTLFVCLLTVLYLRERQRRRAVVPHHQHAEEQD